MFCDETQIKLVAGKGGDGCVSFRREKFVPKGGPDGGDGGNGGDIVIKVNPHLNTLTKINTRKLYKAENGIPGRGKNQHGKNASPLILEVPKGTIIFNSDKSNLIADLNKEGEQIVIAKGGIGGMGNARFVTSTHQVPRFAETGEPGEEIEIILELKMVADVGIIGLPSAGKSTLISVISNAKPKIAAYHFTTITPNLGVVNFKGNGFVVADIPGLIEGASEGKGLGHQFLKHIQRTKILVHMIDGSLPNPDKNYKTIRKELKKYSKELDKLPEIIVINKIDLLNEETLKETIKTLKKATKAETVHTISAVTHKGLQPLLGDITTQLQKLKKSQPKAEEIKEIPTLRPHLTKNRFQIDKIRKNRNTKTFHISGPKIDQLVIMTDLNNIEGTERIYKYIEKLGIKSEVERKEARIGDNYKIKEKIIPYRP